MKKQKKDDGRISFKLAPKKLSDLRAGASEAQTEPLEPGEEEAETEERQAARRRALRQNATAVIVAATFEAAVSSKMRRRLMHARALAVTVVVPTAAWVVPITAYLKSELPDQWCFQARSGSARWQDPSKGADDVARDLSKGFSVMGIAADASQLPAPLAASPDIEIRIAPPDGAVLRRAIRRFSGRSPGDVADDAAGGLDLHAIVSAFRPGAGAAAIVRRLQAASSAGRGAYERVPDLRTAVEYGDARTFGLNLARDIADLRAAGAGAADTAAGGPATFDRGIVLVSPPGFGKTLYASALARFCRVPLVSTSVGDWFTKGPGPGYLDTVLRTMRESFQTAAMRANPISILHLDEIDALPDRASMSAHAREWWSVMVAEALLLLDGALSARSNVVVVASTNLIDRVDPALLRPGRLEKVVRIGPPDLAGTINIMRFHLDGELEDDLGRLGVILHGRTPAEIMYVIRGARRTARHAGRPLAAADVEDAAMPREEHPPARLFRMAVHEAAHAVAALALGVGTIDSIVLQSADGEGGRAIVNYRDDDLATRATIEDRVTVALAARAAERQETGAVSTGSGGATNSDIGFSNVALAGLHGSFGMSGAPLYFGAGPELLRAIAMDGDLRRRVERDLVRLERRAARLVAANRDAILAVAGRLAEKRHLGGAEIEAIVRGRLRCPRRRGPSKSNP